MDIQTGVSVAQIGSKDINVGSEAAFYADFLKSQQQLAKRLSLQQTVQEIVFTSTVNYHLICPFELRILRVRPPEHLFFYVVFSREVTNLSSASLKIKAIISEFVF